MLHDKDIRDPLFEFLEETYGKVRILEEKNMGSSRADVVMVTENDIYGIEIKSDADTYARLESQIKDYDRFFDYNIIAVGTSHGLHVHEHVPSHWGIITIEEVDGKPDFYMFRKPTINQAVSWNHKLELMWRPELAKIQELYEMPKYKDKSKRFVIDKIAEWAESKIPEEDLKRQVSELLLERDYSKIFDEINAYRKSINLKPRRRKRRRRRNK